ncbi:MAG: hypothetical protein ACLQOO_16255 [Terriglobia bacterium]
MAAYQNTQGFIQRAKDANPSFERFKKSSLRPLIDVLKDTNGSLQRVRTALAALPPAKANEYKDAIYYLLGDYSGLWPFPRSVNFGPLDKLNAAEFSRTDLPQGYDPSRPQYDRIVAPSRFLNLTVEQYLISNPGTGVILIHLSKHDAGMDMVFNGEKCIDHIKSVLRVANDNKRDLCILYMEEPPVLSALQAEVAASVNKVHVLVKQQHMGGRHPWFLGFAQRHNHVVVMGFDATVCVEANLFGTAETMDDGSFVPPLTTISNVVTSRAVLVTTGTLTPLAMVNKGQWGCLHRA